MATKSDNKTAMIYVADHGKLLAENEVVSDKTVVEAGFDVCKGDSIGGVFWRCSMTNWMQERRFLR